MVNVSDRILPAAVVSAQRWLKKERTANLGRDLAIRRLNNAYDTRLSDLDAGQEDYTFTRTLKDEPKRPGETEGSTPRYSEVPVPMVRAITEDWKSVMAVTPNHYCPPVSPGDDTSEREAERRENIVSGIYWDSQLDFRMQEDAHYRSLHGGSLRYALPDPSDKRVRIEARSSYKTYARLKNARRDLMFMAWDWDEDTEYVLDQFPGVERYFINNVEGWELKGERLSYPDKVTMTEWYDEKNRLVMVNDTWIEAMPWAVHNWGFVPGQVVPNIVGVGLWGQSDALYAVHLAQLYSETLSMMQDGIFQTIYDIPIIFDDNAVGKIQIGPHEALQMSSGAHTGTLRGNVKMPEGNLILDILERTARLGAGWPKVQSSEMDSPIISGKAFVAAQGPVAARAAIKHIVSAISLERVTGYALRLYEHHFPDDEIELYTVPGAVRTSVVADRTAMGSQVRFVPSRDIGGVYWVVINFPPGGADQYRATIEQLQLMEAGVVSVETVRQARPGINPKVERVRTDREFREKAALQAEGATIMAQAQMAMQAQMAAGMQGGGPAGPPGAAPAGPPGGQPGPAAPSAGAGGPPPAVNVERAQPQAPTPGGTEQGWPRVTRAAVRAELAAVRPLRGRVFLMGAIARLGWTTGMIEIGLSDMVDKATITQKTTYGKQGRLVFQQVDENTAGGPGIINVTPTA